MEDWKTKLAALKGDLPVAEETDSTTEQDHTTAAAPKKTETLHVLIEKKGRGGKTATIIEGFECDDEELKSVAKQLQKSMGTGGSARGGEILLQGDCRAKAAEKLRGMGYKVKG